MANQVDHWEGTARNRGLVVTAILLLPLALIGLVNREGLFAGFVVLVCAYSVVIFSSIRVVADQQLFVVRAPLFPRPLKVIPLTQIRAAEWGLINPWKFGGWGYRICGRGCRAVVVRRGEGIRLSLPDNKTFVVTVSDAEAGASWIADRVPSALSS